MLRDRIVEGVADPATRLKLLQQPQLTAESAINLCRAMEAAKANLKAMEEPKEKDDMVDIEIDPIDPSSLIQFPDYSPHLLV